MKRNNFGHKTLKIIGNLFDETQLYSLLCILMLLLISSCLIIGPDPRLKIFAIGSETKIRQISDEIYHLTNGEVIIHSINEERNEFKILVNTRYTWITLIVDPNFTGDDFRLISWGFGDSIPFVIVFEEALRNSYALKLVSEAHTYDVRVFVVNNDLEMLEVLCYVREKYPYTIQNLWGIPINRNIFFMGVKFIGFLSLFIISYATFMLVIAIVKGFDGKTSIDELIRTLAFSAILFVLIQSIFFACSCILHIPLSLHSTKITDPEHALTVIGFLGPFGGGTSPKLLASFLGCILGVLLCVKTQRLSLRIKALIVGVVLLAIGIWCFIHLEFPRWFVNAIITEFRYRFCGTILPSRGIILFIFCCALLSLLCKCDAIDPSVKSMIIPFVISGISWGLIRIGNLNFEQTAVSLVLGFLFSLTLPIVISLLNNRQINDIIKRFFSLPKRMRT